MRIRRLQFRLLNLFAFSLLGFAIYLNFFFKDEASVISAKNVIDKAGKPAAQVTNNQQATAQQKIQN